jgi:Xaa-Pro dipeptidase
MGLRTGRVAVEPTTRFFILSGLEKALPGVDFVDGETYSERCRIIKSPREIEYLRVADRITKTAYETTLSSLWEGISEEELGDKVAEAHRQQGSRGGAMVLFGLNSALPHGSSQVRKLRVGDVLLMDGGCSVKGYRSDVTRSMVFGEPSELHRRIWEIVLQAQSAAIEAIRPGLTCGELDSIARKVIEDAGYGPDYRFFTHRLGHGLGMDGHEPPYLVRGNPLVLEPGMVFTVEPGIYLRDQWGIRHEDVVVVTEDGVEVFGERSSKVNV